MMHFLAIGFLLGLSAGLAPGPLLTLVVSQTIQYDVRAGIKIALAPLVSDLPIVVLTVFVLSRLEGFDIILGCISIVGGMVVMKMGIDGIKTGPLEIDISGVRPRSLLKGAAVNVLSPHPYLFWLGVGAPTMARAYEYHFGAAVCYILSFYLLLIGSKVVLAVLVGKSKKVLTGRIYIYVMRGLGLMLCCLALFLFRDGLAYMGAF